MVRLCLLVILGATFVLTRPADACSCSSWEKPCEGLARADVVFVGRVKAVVGGPQRDPETTITVEEVFRGSPGPTALIKMGGPDQICDYSNYRPGTRMLIFARVRPDGALYVYPCSPTAPVAMAAADLAELRRAAKRGTGRVSGRVTLADGTPRANIEVRAAGTSLATRTNTKGEYRLELPRGVYTIEPDSDPGFAPRKPSPLEIGAPGVCATLDFTEQWNGRIRGRLLDPRGKPAAKVLVRAFPASATVPLVLDAGATWTVGASARSDASGNYELGPLAPDTYRVAVGAPFDPAEPFPATYHGTDLVVPRGGLVSGVDLLIPPRLKLHKLTGRVIVRGNVPTTYLGLDVTLTELASKRTYQHYHSLHSPSFEFTEVAGTTVELRACANDLACTKSVLVRLDRDAPVDLVLTIP